MIQDSIVFIAFVKMTLSDSDSKGKRFHARLIKRPNKKIPVFMVTRPYLDLLVKPGIYFMYSGINIILCILKGELPFKMHEIIFFCWKNIIRKIYMPTLPKIFRPVIRNTLIFFLLGLTGFQPRSSLITMELLILHFQSSLEVINFFIFYLD